MQEAKLLKNSRKESEREAQICPNNGYGIETERDEPAHAEPFNGTYNLSRTDVRD